MYHLVENGSSYMDYYKNYNMWRAEAGTWNTNGQSLVTLFSAENDNLPIIVYDGDVAVIDLKDNYLSRFRPEPLWIW